MGFEISRSMLIIVEVSERLIELQTEASGRADAPLDREKDSRAGELGDTRLDLVCFLILAICGLCTTRAQRASTVS